MNAAASQSSAMAASRLSGMRRAIIGAVALYGLLLQAFLTGMAPQGAPALDAGIHAALCAPADGQGGGDQPARHAKHDCCLAASVAVAASSLDRAETAVAWPARRSTRVSWTAVDYQPTTGPPRSATSARGPPSA